MTGQLLLQFLNADGNILVTLGSDTTASTALVSLLTELDIQLPAERTGLVVDHFNYDSASAPDKHDVLLLPPPGSHRPGVKDIFSAGAPSDQVIAFPHGVGATLGAGELLTPLLRAPSTAYSYDPSTQAETVDDPFAAGQQLSLISTFQSRTSARFTLVGSAELLADKWFDAEVQKPGAAKAVKTFNREFAKRVAGWTFQEIGVLRVNWIEHHLNEVGGSNETNPKIYRIKNDVVRPPTQPSHRDQTNPPQTYTISLSEYVWDAWTAFTVPPNDLLQLEFSMLSPFHRLTLQPDAAHSAPGAAAFTASFKLPDQHGIFNFKINYKRPFFTNVEEKNTVSVRHMAHDEWPRSFVISGAWPWIAGIGATVAGWLGFCALWMYSAPVGKKDNKKTQ